MTKPPLTLKVGDRAPERTVGPITRTHIVRFAGAGGDFNPMHHDEEFARSAGMDGVFAMGQMQAGMLAAYLADWVGREHVRSYAVRFKSQVWPGDELSFAGVVTELIGSPESPVARLDLTAERGGGEVAVVATAEIAIAARSDVVDDT